LAAVAFNQYAATVANFLFRLIDSRSLRRGAKYSTRQSQNTSQRHS